MKSKMKFLRVTVAVTLLVVSFVTLAHATFLGKNGRIAFIQGPDVYSMKSNGIDVKQLTNLGPDNFALYPAWSPDGQQIVFVEYLAPDFVGQLWLMDRNGGNQHRLLNDSGFADEHPSFSPDGNYVVFSRARAPVCFDVPCQIYRVGVDGSGLKRLTEFNLQTIDRNPAYSPDGKMIAFTSLHRRGILGAVYLMNADGTNIHRLTPPEPGIRGPDWSPDGNKIVFRTRCCNPQNEEIWVVNFNGLHLHRLTKNGNDYFNGPHDFYPGWSPQGDAIVFERDAPDFSSSAIYVLKQDGSEMREKLILTLQSQLPVRQLRTSTRRDTKGRERLRLRQIEEGGALPRWGVASE
jgi:Tol biopolymer transport system component